jgi:hypothetical protein
MAKKIIEDNMGGKVFAHNIKNGVSFVIQLEIHSVLEQDNGINGQK